MLWVDFVFNALKVLLAVAITGAVTERSKRIHQWTARFEALLEALQARINGNPAPFNLKTLIAANPVTANAGTANVYVDFIFEQLQTIVVNSIKNPNSAAAQRLLVWVDRIEALLEDLNTKFEITEASAPGTSVPIALTAKKE